MIDKSRTLNSWKNKSELSLGSAPKASSAVEEHSVGQSDWTLQDQGAKFVLDGNLIFPLYNLSWNSTDIVAISYDLMN